MKTISPDTSPEAEAVLLRLAREMPPRRKFEIAASMSETIRQAARAGVVARHPGASEEEIKRRLTALILPQALAIRVYGWDPRRDGL